MASFTYNISNRDWKWDADITLEYEAVYNAAANTTTITVTGYTAAYFGRSGYGTSADTTLTVQAGDNASDAATVSLTLPGNSTTNGARRTFTGTASPSSVTVKHGTGAAKTLSLSAVTTVKVYPASDTTVQQTFTGNGSETVTLAEGIRAVVYIDTGSGFEPYEIYIDNGNGWELYQVYIDNGSGWEEYGG